MGLRDALRGLRHGAGASLEDAAGATEITSDTPDPVSFQPRSGGSYDGSADAGAHRWLRFSGSRVIGSGDRLLVGSADPALARGEYTPAGRFSVQRPLERAAVFTVLESGPTGFRARYTDTAAGHTRELDYVFVPDDGVVGEQTD